MREQELTRRHFLKYAAWAPVCAAAAWNLSRGQVAAQQPIARVGGAKLKIGLNAYSFSKLLNDHLRGRGPGMTLFDLLEFCAQHDFEAIDPTGYFFPGYPKVPADSYIFAFKRRAFDLGLAISGTGVRNDFATTDAQKRAADVQHVKEWVEVAAKLGAPVLRVFAGPVPEGYEGRWEEVAKWLADSLRQCAEHAAKYGVIIGVQNHGDMLKSADDVIRILKMVDSPWLGAINDTGYFLTANPYEDIARIVPYTVNWQIKERLGGKNGTEPMDLKRLFRIIRAGGYRGYVPIETLSQPGTEYNPREVVPQFLKKVREALEATA